MRNSKQPSLRIIPLGGLGEVGKNMTVFELGNDAFIIDAGIMFPANDMFGVDYIIPDFGYVTERRSKGLNVRAIVFTHGHEDHVGAVQHVVQAFPGVPLYGTPLTAALLQVKLQDAGLHKTTTVHKFQAGDTLTFGPFTLESFHVTHSIPDCVGFGISTPYGMVIHSGDYKFDNSPVDGKKPDYAKLAEFSKRGVLLLMGDSTNADQPGWTPSETVVDAALDTVFRNAKGRVVVATFASHISRIHQVADAAARHGRKIAVAGHSMAANIKMCRDLGMLKIPDEMFINLDYIGHVPANQVCILATGAQGEPSAALGRLATGRHRQLDVQEGDTIVLSAHTIPGNEESVGRTINRLFQRGAEVIYDSIIPVHVSGHAKQEEMKLLINLTRPKYFLPVHGELRHLRAHAKLAAQTGIPRENIFVVENGYVIEVDSAGVRVGERIPGGYVFVDGGSVGDIAKDILKDREILADDGFFTVSVTISKKSGQLVGEPEIITRGFVTVKAANELAGPVRVAIQDTLASGTATQNQRRRERMQDAVGRVLYSETRRRPLVFCIINEI